MLSIVVRDNKLLKSVVGSLCGIELSWVKTKVEQKDRLK
jgi:hypothetical protein